MNCPDCDGEMQNGGLYVRGFGGSLFWSPQKDIGFVSRKGLEQIDLSEVSLTPTAGQAVLDSWRCNGCGWIAFGSRA